MWNQIVEQTFNSITKLHQQRIKRILKKKLKLHYLKHLKINNPVSHICFITSIFW